MKYNYKNLCLACVAQLAGHCPANRKVAGLIPGQHMPHVGVWSRSGRVGKAAY